MPLFIWKDAFNTNIQELDDQHRRFFEIINRLNYAHGSDKERSVLVDTFSELIDYIQVHFATEENLLERFQYPELEHHRKLHAIFTERVTELFRNYLADTALITQTTMQFLQDWLVSHIIDEDMKYRDFMDGKL